MTWLALALLLAQGTPPPDPPPWRLVDRPGLHVGLRPAAELDNEADGRLEGGIGVTVQVTAFVP